MTFKADIWRHGPMIVDGGVRFRLWAPSVEKISLVIEGRPPVEMSRVEQGFLQGFVKDIGPGARYKFELPDGRRVPDPASRFQPLDVHGPSEVIDPTAYAWRRSWQGRPWREVVLYELHVGAFTPEGTYIAAIDRLPHLAELGVTAVEIMPLSDFAGRWNWGYDGVLPYAPDSSYGRPDELKAFVDAAHEHGICVVLDVVYNHFGPDGNYLSAYAPEFFAGHNNPWGAVINFSGPNSRPVREYFLQNAEYWIEEFHLDGLRLDAVHEIKDDSEVHFLDELAVRLRRQFDRPIHLIIENENNEPNRLVRQGGEIDKYTAQLNDDHHHVLHVAATGEADGYYSAYGGTEQLAKTLAEGFAYQGEFMPYRGRPRGGRSDALPPGAFVFFIQNHDQIGNRAFGERLTALASPERLRALASLYLLAPQTPMLFMGEELGATTPFLFFCDFTGEMADGVREGRRREFSRFPEFSDPERAARIPDPLARTTYQTCKLDWNGKDPSTLELYRQLLKLRREHVIPCLQDIERAGEYEILENQAVRIAWRAASRRLVVEANLSDDPVNIDLGSGETFWICGAADRGLAPWSIRWSFET